MTRLVRRRRSVRRCLARTSNNRYSQATQNPYFFLGIWANGQNNWTALTGYPTINLNANYTTLNAGSHLPNLGHNNVAVGFFSPATVTLSAWRDFAVGGARITLTDPENPTITDSGLPETTEWTNDATYTVDPNATDPGLGIKSLTLKVPKQGGGYATQTRTHTCTGRRANPCPTTWALPNATANSFTFSTDDADPTTTGNQPMPEGINTIEVIAQDALGKTSTSQEVINIDRTAPELITAGGLRMAEDRDIYGEAYDLSVRAFDESGPGASNAQSGIASIEVQVDGVRQHIAEQPCPEGGCMLEDYSDFVLADHASGSHTITGIARDQAGNSVTESWDITIEDPDIACVPPDYDPHYLESEFEELDLANAQQQCKHGDPMTPRDDYVSYSYGDCEAPEPDPADPEGEIGMCVAPLEIQSAPICERHAELYQDVQTAVVPESAGPGIPGLVLPSLEEPDPPPPGTELPAVSEGADPEDGGLDPYESLTIRGAPAAMFNDGSIEIYTDETTISVLGEDPAQVLRAAEAVVPAPEQAIPEQDEPITEPLPELDPPSPPVLPQALEPASPSELTETIPC
jgi:hypothetical protein